MIKEIFLICALSVPATIWKPPLTDADKVIHEFMALMTQAQTMEDVLFIKKPYKWNKALDKMEGLAQGGIVLIQGNMREFHYWFRSHGFMAMPFMWRDFHVYKKALNSGLFVVKDA